MRKKLELPGVNMTPMIDVVFQMIIFFVCTTELDKMKYDENVHLEWARHGPKVESEAAGTVTVNVRADGLITIGGTGMNVGYFRGIMQSTVARFPGGVPVVIRGDLAAAHHHIREVMDVCKEVGIWKVSFAAIKDQG